MASLIISRLGLLRVFNAKHRVPDVSVGSGVAIISVKLIAFVFEKKA